MTGFFPFFHKICSDQIDERPRAEPGRGDRIEANTATRESREYIGNRIQEATAELASLRRWIDEGLGASNQRDLHQRIQQATERLEYWQSSVKELETKIVGEGGQIASPETIKVGDFIYYAGWLPVIRVNRKTVTVSHWLGVATMTYKIEYRRIEKFRKV